MICPADEDLGFVTNVEDMTDWDWEPLAGCDSPEIDTDATVVSSPPPLTSTLLESGGSVTSGGTLQVPEVEVLTSVDVTGSEEVAGSDDDAGSVVETGLLVGLSVLCWVDCCCDSLVELSSSSSSFPGSPGSLPQH